MRDFDVVAFSVSFETDYLNMARMLRLAGFPLWSSERTHHDPLVVMGGAASFFNPEPIADFTDVVGVGEGEVLVPQLVDRSSRTKARRKNCCSRSRARARLLRAVALRRELQADGTIEAYTPKQPGVPVRVGRAISAENPKEGSLRRAMRRGDTEIAEQPARAGCVRAFHRYLGARSGDGRAFPDRDFARLLARLPLLLGRLQLLAAARRPRARRAGEGRRVAREDRQIGLVSTAVCDHPEISEILQGLREMDYRISVSVLAARPNRGRTAGRARRIARPADRGRAGDGLGSPAQSHQQESDERRDRGHLRRGL